MEMEAPFDGLLQLLIFAFCVLSGGVKMLLRGSGKKFMKSARSDGVSLPLMQISTRYWKWLCS